MVATVLTATAFSYKPGYATQAACLQAFSWVAQFIGHGVAEGRAPALVDNLIGGTDICPCPSVDLTHPVGKFFYSRRASAVLRPP